MSRIKLELQKLTDEELVDLLTLIAGKLDANATFPAAPAAPDTLTDDASAISALLDKRKALLEQAQQITLQIRAARKKGESDLNLTPPTRGDNDGELDLT